MQTYGPLGLSAWPGEPDRFDTEAALYTARQDGVLVGTAVLHYEDYAGQPFWDDGFGLSVADLVPNPTASESARSAASPWTSPLPPGRLRWRRPL